MVRHHGHRADVPSTLQLEAKCAGEERLRDFALFQAAFAVLRADREKVFRLGRRPAAAAERGVTFLGIVGHGWSAGGRGVKPLLQWPEL